MNRIGSAILSLILAGSAFAQDHSHHIDPREQPTHSHEHDQTSADSPTESERVHIPPDPPQHPMGDMSNERMIELMGMDDDAAYSMLQIDQLEWRDGNEDPIVWDAEAFYGDDYNKLWWKFEGAWTDDQYESSSELLWDRIFSRWWSTQLGIRHDANAGPSRTWAAFGIQGLAPYWFEIEATFYVGEQGRTAFQASAEQDILLTQRLILQPELKFEIYGKDDPANRLGSGLSHAEIGLRVRYEIWPEFAPYIGIAWTRSFRETADFAKADGVDSNDVEVVAGVRMWF